MVQKNALFFLSQVPTHHSFTFNLWFLYELKHKVYLSKTCVGFSIFDFVSFLLRFIFLLNKKHRLFDLKHHNSFQIKIIEKPHTLLFPDLWFLSYNQKF